MKTNILKYAGIVWQRLFIGTLITTLIVVIFFPPILVSYEFAAIAQFLALAGAIFCGLSCSYEQITYRLRTPGKSSTRRKRLYRYIGQQTWILLPEILAGLFVGAVMYFMLIYVSVSLFHAIAPKEAFQFDIVANSIRPSTEKFSNNCPYYVQFDVPQISPEAQSVCINENQWRDLGRASFPTTIHIEGEKSYFGYELRYAK